MENSFGSPAPLRRPSLERTRTLLFRVLSRIDAASTRTLPQGKPLLPPAAWMQFCDPVEDWNRCQRRLRSGSALSQIRLEVSFYSIIKWLISTLKLKKNKSCTCRCTLTWIDIVVLKTEVCFVICNNRPYQYVKKIYIPESTLLFEVTVLFLARI